VESGDSGDGFTPVGRRIVSHASFLTLERMHLSAPDGAAVARVVVRHPGAVAVVAMEGEEVVLLRQYRAPVGRELLEVPAGKLDFIGEDPTAAARRELAEEVGLAGSLVPLITMHTTPGFSNETIAIFLAGDLRAVPMNPHGAEERAAIIVRMPLSAAIDAVLDGEITDAKTIVGLFAAAERR
jgi:8-oxo-dGTP pyrophosphatase MutT (NUDIX family)